VGPRHWWGIASLTYTALTLSQTNRKIRHVENNALNPFVLDHIDGSNASILPQSDILMSSLRFKSSGMHTVSHGKWLHSGPAYCQETGLFTNTAKRILNLIMSSCLSAHTFTHIIIKQHLLTETGCLLKLWSYGLCHW